MKASVLAEKLTSSVARLYDRFPYPHYPLLAKPRWQEGYLASSRFAARLVSDCFGVEAAVDRNPGQFLQTSFNILVAGSGEILPYVIRQLEPSHHRVLCVDLSAKSIRRARFRLAFSFDHTDFVRADINRFLHDQATVTGPFHHADLYGVLHHLPEPGQTLKFLSAHLSRGGTARIMVYNSKARDWIFQFQRVFRILGLDAYNRSDRQTAKDLLREISDEVPGLKAKLSQLGSRTLNNDARLVDTFFHSREARIDLPRWLELIREAGLVPFALVDRYGELDDLENPMWSVPSGDCLVERAADKRFENNFELFLTKRGESLNSKPMRPSARSSLSLRNLVQGPPRFWFSFPETNSVPFKTRLRLWLNYARYIDGAGAVPIDSFKRELTLSQMQRLARLGAIFPGQVEDQNLKVTLNQPICETMSTPGDLAKPMLSEKTILRIRRLLEKGQKYSERRLNLIVSRLTSKAFYKNCQY